MEGGLCATIRPHISNNSRHLFLLVLFAALCKSSGTDDVGLIEEIPASISRTLVNPGFHRELTTEITLEHEHQDRIIKGHTNCTIMILETFSEGVYVDQDEVNNLELLGIGGNHIHFFNEVDIEKPAYLSSKNIVLIYHNYFPLSQSDKNNHIVNVTIPIHFRYQLPSPTTTHKRVYINSPLIYISCSSKSSQPSSPFCVETPDKKCDMDNNHNLNEVANNINNNEDGTRQPTGWVRLIPVCEVYKDDTEPSTEDTQSQDEVKHNNNRKIIGDSSLRIVVEIPVGLRHMENTVTWVTLCVTVLGAVVVMYFVVATENRRAKEYIFVTQEEELKAKKN